MAASNITYEPLPRDNHAAVAVGSKLYVWGGWAGWREKSQELSKTIEMFDITTEVWEQIPTHGTQPPALWNTAYTVVGTSLYIFGGWDGVSCHNSLYKLDLCTFQWEEVKITNPSTGPQRKFGSGMVSYRDNELVVFAGFTDNGTTNELHVFNLDKGEWSSPATTGIEPPPVFAFSFTKIDSKRAVAYGGCGSRGTSGDAYVFELDKWHWRKLDTSGRPSPPARFSHAAAACSIGVQQEHPLLLVKGGCVRLVDHLENILMEVLKDMWVLDVDRAVWSKVTLPQEMEPRYQHTANVVDSRLNFSMVIMFGGTRKFLGDPLAETNLLHLGCLGSSWEVTRVVTMEDLKRPVGRLREQLAIFEEKVRKIEAEKQAAETRAENAEKRIADLQQMAAFGAQELDTLKNRAEDAEREVRRLEKEKCVNEARTKRRIADLQTRAEEAERRAADAEKTATVLIKNSADANQRVRDAETRAQEYQRMVTQAEQRSTHAEHRATQAEIEVHFVQQRLDNMALRVREAEQSAREAQERARTAEQRIQRLEARSHDQFWTVHREEIQFTDQELGRGGWAVVRVAKFRGLQVAAKCLHTLIVSDYNRQLFVREMNIAARVRHPNLVQFIGATVEGELVILTELMATSLRVVLQSRPFNPPQINSMCLDVARALNYLHHMRPDPILHRDISSANILLEPGPSNSWRAKVSDYGSANFLQQLRTAGPGNPVYAAPEADFPSQQSPKMDVYSYGVLLLEMCSRRFPSPEEHEALLQRVQQPTMVALIQQCMEQEPTRRPTMSDIIGQLE